MYKELISDAFIAKAAALTDDDTKEIITILNTMALIIPTKAFLLIDKYIVPIKPQFLRESIKEIKFKYSGSIKLIGRVTAPFQKAETNLDPATSIVNATKALDSAINETLAQLGLINTRFILSPIALYF